MNKIDIMLDEKIDEILIDFDTWCLCKADECVLAQNFKQAKQAILSKLESIEQEAYKKGYIDRGIRIN